MAKFLALTVKAHVHSVTQGQLRKPQRTYVKRAVRKAHFKLNQAFKVIQGIKVILTEIQNGVSS